MKHFLMMTALAVAVALAPGSAQAQGDADKGAKVFRKCKACHQLEQGKTSPIGPNLYGVFGRNAGTGDFKRYSKAMKESGIVWSAETLAAYLKKPKAYIPGNRMTFAGLRKQKDIDNVIAYLKQATQ